jgi:hypothetical protein
MARNGLRKVTAGAAALALTLAATAAADEVRLKSGRTVEGIVRREPGKVIVESRLGTLTYPADEVQDVVPGRTPMHEFAEREAALGPSPKAEDVFALALWAQDQGLVRYVHPLLERTVRLDPNFAPARRLLDQVQIGGRWMTRSERDALAEAAATRAEGTAPGRARRVVPTRPLPEMTPGYVYFGIPPYAPPRGSQNWGCCGYAFPMFRGVVIVP